MATGSSSRSSRNTNPMESIAGILDLGCRRFFLSTELFAGLKTLDWEICSASLPCGLAADVTGL
jgi:hypothetical protein